MALVAFAMLLATSLLQLCACDMQASRAQFARKLKASMSTLPRLDARELREEADRRLTMNMMQTTSQECLAACPDVQWLQAEITTASQSLMQSSGESLLQGGDSLSDMVELMAEAQEITVDAYCAHRLAVQCVVDNPIPCSAESEAILEYAPKLDCLCDACPSANKALADFTGLLMNAIVDAFSELSGDDMPFDTEDFGADSTTDWPDDMTDGLDDMTDGLDDMTEADLQMMCSLYPLISCTIDFPSQCGGGILLDDLDMSNMTNTDDSLALAEDMCPSTTAAPGGSGHGGSGDGGSGDESADEDAASNCGPVSLGWLSVSLVIAVAALAPEAV